MKRIYYILILLLLAEGNLRAGGRQNLNGNRTPESPMNSLLASEDDKPATHMLAIATNPANYFINQYPISLDYITPKFSHEVRFNYFDHSRKFIGLAAKTIDVGSLPFVKSTGIEASYTFKWMLNRPFTHRIKYPYHGVQFRFAYRKWDPYNSDIITKEGKVFNDEIQSSSNYYDVCYIFGTQIRYRRLFVDTYAGGGLGYKTLTTNYDPSKYDIYDFKFNTRYWNTIYPAIRLGIRVGVII